MVLEKPANVWEQEEMDIQLKQKVRSLLLHFWVLVGPSEDWRMFTCISEDTHLHSVCQFKCKFLPEKPLQTYLKTKPSQTPKNNVLQAIWASLNLVKLTQKIDNHVKAINVL